MPVATDHAGLSWQEPCEDPRFAFLDDLPFKVETNRRGQIVMSPTRFRHSYFQKQLIRLLDECLGSDGEAFAEVAVETPGGVKVPAVVWLPAERVAEAQKQFALPAAPPLCAEVLLPYNTCGEMEEKIRLYLDAGASEVWVCDLDGRMRFFDRDGERSPSARVPDFPKRIESP